MSIVINDAVLYVMIFIFQSGWRFILNSYGNDHDRNSEADVMCCRFNEEGSMLAAGLINGVIKVCSFEIIKILKTFLKFICSSLVVNLC